MPIYLELVDISMTLIRICTLPPVSELSMSGNKLGRQMDKAFIKYLSCPCDNKRWLTFSDDRKMSAFYLKALILFIILDASLSRLALS